MKKTTGAKSRKAAKAREAKTAKKPKAAAGQRKKKRDDRPLEVRYREARERVTEPDGHGGTRYRTDYTPEAWAEYIAILESWPSHFFAKKSEVESKAGAAKWKAELETDRARAKELREARMAEREKRDEIAYSEEDAEYIRDAFEGGLTGPARWHYETLTEREKKRAVGLYDERAYDFSDGPADVSKRAEANGEDWASELPADVLEAASKREFLLCITEGETDARRIIQHYAKKRGEARDDLRCVLYTTVTAYHWEKYVEEAGLVLDAGAYYLPETYAKLELKRKREREEAERRRAEEAEREKREAAEREIGRKAIQAALAGAGVPVAPDAPAPVAPGVATPAASLTSRLCDRPLSVGKGKTTHVFVRRGNTKRGGVGKGYTITFGLWQGQFYTESPRVLTFFEDALKAMSKRLMGKAENESYVKLPDGVTSRNATAKLWQGKADRTMRSCLKFGKGLHKNEARLEIPSSYL